jgi:hypothetical protein
MTMKDDDELRRILEAERLEDDGPEMREIRRVRAEVEAILNKAFGTADVSIKYGGSKAKGTMLMASYDLDILIYFHRNNDRAGTTLEAIYKSVAAALTPYYYVDPRTTALRLHAKDDRSSGPGLRVDVVPGRYIDDTTTSVFLYQKDDEKDRLMTDPVEHVRFVRESGVLDAVCALKLWRVKNDLRVKQFPFEILCVNLLKPYRQLGLADQVKGALIDIANMTAPPRLEDPGNPSRDLSSLMEGEAWSDLHAAAQQAANMGWVWSDILMTEALAGAPAIVRAVENVHVPTRPWST